MNIYATCYNIHMDFRKVNKELLRKLDEYSIRSYGINRRGRGKMAIEDAIECLLHFEQEYRQYKNIFKNKIDLYDILT